MNIMKRVRVLLALVGMIGGIGLFCGCEDGSSFDYGDNNPNVWVAMGDSITSGLDGEAEPYPPRLARLSGMTVINEGYSGEMAVDAQGRIWNLLNEYKPGRIMILYGVNDIMHHQDIEDIVGALRFMVQAAVANKTMVKLATLTPMIDRHNGIFQGTIEEVNYRIRLMAAEEGVEIVDLEPLFGTGSGLQIDGLHPNDAGSDIIAAAFY